METKNNQKLDEAVAAWRRTAQDESLSGAARTSLFAGIQGNMGAAEAGFVPSVARAWRWAFLGSVPVVAIATVLLMVGDRGRPTVPAQLSATKVNGQLVFTMANGKTDHVIRRSTDAKSFDSSRAVKMARNRYAENATGGPNLVFYRID